MLIGNYTYLDVFPKLPSIEQHKNKLLTEVKSGNSRFDALFKGLIEAEFEAELYHFLQMPRTTHPKEDEYPEVFARVASTKHFSTTEVFNYEFGMQYINGFLTYLYVQKGIIKNKPVGHPLAELSVEYVHNDTVIGQYVLKNALTRAKAYDQVYLDRVAKYGKYLITADQKKALADFELTIRSYKQGEQAIDFAGATIDGKMVKLSDFKGKVVLVDVWATWCAPCKQEIPSLQKLEEEMKGLDVVFISYSVDAIKDKDKWKEMVVKDKLGGVQLMGDAAFKSSICVDYKINAIPRFMVFGKKGQIVTIDAPRPSNPDLKALLEKQLGQ